MKNLVSLIVGFLFALGLGMSGMTQTHVVKGFLDVFGSWNINLMGVMLGAIAVHSIAYQFIKQKKTPLLNSNFHLPLNTHIDKRLVTGAAIFGLGWGWAGICPGPAIVGLASGNINFALFVIAMLVGMILFKMIEKKFLVTKKIP